MKAEEYLEHARRCEEQAEEARTPDVKHTLLSLAKEWRHMAEQIEQLERSDNR